MSTFATDYYLFVLVASLGVIQVASSLGRLTGLLVFKPPVAARTFGLGLVVSSFIWFFATDNRNLNDYDGGLDANEQALLFSLGAVTAIFATAVLSSILNARMDDGHSTPRGGLEALRHTNYARALARSLRYRFREWHTQMRSYFSG